jgi:hypothetical protein
MLAETFLQVEIGPNLETLLLTLIAAVPSVSGVLSWRNSRKARTATEPVNGTTTNLSGQLHDVHERLMAVKDAADLAAIAAREAKDEAARVAGETAGALLELSERFERHRAYEEPLLAKLTTMDKGV